MKFLAITLAFLATSVFACKEGELKCLAAQDDGRDGGVFKCVNNMWHMFQDCSASERCYSKPTPHCAWRAAAEAAAPKDASANGN